MNIIELINSKDMEKKELINLAVNELEENLRVLARLGYIYEPKKEVYRIVKRIEIK